MKITVHDFVWMYVSVLLGIYLVVKFLGHIVALFNFSRNCQTVFQSIILHSHGYEGVNFSASS